MPSSYICVMKPQRLYLFSLLSGALLALSWPAIGWAPLIFIAWVPLLMVEEIVLRDGRPYNNLRLFGHAYLAFLTWNIGATWWIVNASLGGALLAFIANSALMAGVFTLFHAARKRIPSARSIWYLPVFWLAFEFLHHDWDLTWPWLTLGNAFAGQYQLIQWYEFTGSLGGSLWVLLINIGIFAFIKKWSLREPGFRPLTAVRRLILGLLAPMLLSLVLYYLAEDKGEPVHVAIVQPNVDPYNEKFSDDWQEVERFLELAATVTDSSTGWLLLPETALVGYLDERHMEEDERIMRIRQFMEAYPRLNILTGAESLRFYLPGEEKSPTARKARRSEDIYYDSYNTALLINRGPIGVYHKSRLVPGVEQMPFPSIFKFVESWAIDMGGATGTRAIQKERSVFKGNDTTQVVAPSICYESVYGDFMRQYVANGANFIGIITNDGWWGDTPGYRQHLAYARLRAIENRRSIARSANTGVSCFINQRGDISQAQPYWKPAAIKATIRLNTARTVYSFTGDLLGRSAVWLSAFFIGWMAWMYYVARWRQKQKPGEEKNSLSHG